MTVKIYFISGKVLKTNDLTETDLELIKSKIGTNTIFVNDDGIINLKFVELIEVLDD